MVVEETQVEEDLVIEEVMKERIEELERSH